MALNQNQGDLWLTDFLKRPSSHEAITALTSAIRANYKGDLKRAIDNAKAAANAFNRLGNVPGMLLGKYELVYALGRRQSEECLQTVLDGEAALSHRSYRWLELQFAIEHAICEGQLGHFDKAAEISNAVEIKATSANYPSLTLRSMSLLSSWDTQEGRFGQSWKINLEGLADFWNGVFPAERGFQLYSDLELASEQVELWHLAYLLQREVLTMINETGRLDFQATAHLHLAIAAAATGATQEAQEEFINADTLFAMLKETQETRFLESDNKIGAVQLEIDRGEISAAENGLAAARKAMNRAKSIVAQIRYNRMRAALERKLAAQARETVDLQRVITIGNKGYRFLKSERDRWDWAREVGSSYRRLLELEMEQPHSTNQALADWELYKFRQSVGGKGFTGPAIRNQSARDYLLREAPYLRDSTLIAFAIFPQWTIVWLIDDRGDAHERRVEIAADDLHRLVERFYLVCSDPNSPLEKVKSEGLRLYRVLIGPVSQYIEQKRLLLIESDDLLSVLPWAALTTDAGDYFGEQQTMMQVPGLFDKSSAPAQPKTPRSILIAYPGAITVEGRLYPDLPEGKQEAEYIRTKYSNVSYLHDEEVTAEALRRSLGSTSIFHFIGHAVSDEYGGELVVHGKNGGELFSSSTMSRLDLNRTELVVLSACSTATASGESARDPNGLVRAFLRSGTEQVLASQWDVSSESTAMFMEHFHSLVAAGSNTADALTQSRNALIRAPKSSHPYYWASFELFGTQSRLSN